MTDIVQFENVGLRYGAGPETLSDVSFTLDSGSFYFLTGASGAGKTSLLKLLYLSQRPSRGVIRLFGEDAVLLPRDRLPGFRRRIGVVFQDFRLVPHLSVCRQYRAAAARSPVSPDAGHRGSRCKRDARLGRPRPSARARKPADAVGRRAAARGDRAGGDRPARDPGRRRADWQCRSRHGRTAAARCSTRLNRAGDDGGGGDPRLRVC